MRTVGGEAPSEHCQDLQGEGAGMREIFVLIFFFVLYLDLDLCVMPPPVKLQCVERGSRAWYFSRL